MSGTPEWYAMRQYDPDRTPSVVIGASEASAACGVCPYQTTLDLYLKKRGEWEGDRDNDAMMIGRVFESGVLDHYDDQNGVTTSRQHPMYFCQEHPCIAATPDGMLGDRAVDAKITSKFMLGDADHQWGTDGTDEVPQSAQLQGQQQCLVMEVDRVDFAVFVTDLRKFKTYTVWRNEQLIRQLIDTHLELVDRIIYGDPPPLDLSSPTAGRALQYLHPIDPDEIIILTDGMAESWLQRAEIKKQIKALENEAETISNMVKSEMKNARVGVFPDGSGEISRVVVKDLMWTQEYVDSLQGKVGGVRRRGSEHLRTRERK